MGQRIVVTGGSGLAGSAVVRELVAHRYDVLSVDRVAPSQPLCAYKLADLTDLGQCYEVLTGAQAIVHLAAIPRPIYDTPEQVFRVNVMAAFNVFEAAVTLGINRVVYASSVSVLGFPFYSAPLAPKYVPIDEAHPRLPQDAYGLSKYFGEEIAAATVRRTNGKMTVVSLRFPWIHTPESFKAQIVPFWDKPEDGASNLWSYVDTRDAARACRLALDAAGTTLHGHEAFFISAANSCMKTDSAALVHTNFPDTEIRDSLKGDRSLLDTHKAARVLGFTPAYNWQSYFAETI
jgi:nucleoside-diphosphate-sugar epimerase